MNTGLDTLMNNYGFQDYKEISGEEVVVSKWVRYKCEHMCRDYGERAVCPPNTPPVEHCEAFFKEYNRILVIRISKKAHHKEKDSEVFKPIDKALSDLEKDLFYKGYYKVMMMPPTICDLCEECVPDRKRCKHKETARPTPEAFAVDVFETVRRIGYPLKVLSDYQSIMNRYAFILLE